MPRALDNLAGQWFGELYVLSRASAIGARHATWLVACMCGKRAIVRGQNLRAGNTRTCGHGSNNPAGRRGTRYVPC